MAMLRVALGDVLTVVKQAPDVGEAGRIDDLARSAMATWRMHIDSYGGISATLPADVFRGAMIGVHALRRGSAARRSETCDWRHGRGHHENACEA